MSEDSLLPVLGKQLKQLRKSNYPNDDQNQFATRISVSRSTYQRMEKGDLSVSLAHYYRAAELLGIQDRFLQLFEEMKETQSMLSGIEL
jgi:transcriptional regulator with XRE-family HTH domain